MKTKTTLLVIALAFGAPSLARAQTRPATAPAAASTQTHFEDHQIHAASAEELRSLLAGQPPKPAATGIAAVRAVSPDAAHLAAHAHLLVPGGAPNVKQYARVVVSPTHVALVRHDGVVELVRHEDAKVQIARGTPVSTEREHVAQVGRTALHLEHGPGDTVRLYRQLPEAAKGETASKDHLTSFALSHDDAYHPFGPPGTTVVVAMPRALYQGAVDQTHGGTGWSGGGMGIDVLGEVQIESHLVRGVTPAASTPAASTPPATTPAAPPAAK